MKNILTNVAILYFIRLGSLFLLYPIEGLVSRFFLNTDIYQIRYFTFLSIWYYFITGVIYALIWAFCFYFFCNFISNKIHIKLKVTIVSILIFVFETLLKYQHDIIKNKTFFNKELFEIDFFQYLIGQIIVFFIFLYLYIGIGIKIVKRPTMLP